MLPLRHRERDLKSGVVSKGYETVLLEVENFAADSVWSAHGSGFAVRPVQEVGQGDEQITVVIRGHADVRLGDRFQRVGPGTIMFEPSNVDHYGLSPVDGEDLVLLEFQPIVREDMRRALAPSSN